MNGVCTQTGYRCRANHRRWALPLVLLSLSLLAGCASQLQIPQSSDDSALRARAQTATNRGVRLSAAVLSSEDSRRLLGIEARQSGIQPIWLEVRNETPNALWLLRTGTDPDYFSPLEVAWSFHAALAKAHNAAIDAHFDALAFKSPIAAGETRTGIIYASPHQRTRLLNVDLLGRRQLIPFTLFLPVPDDAIGDDAVERLTRQAGELGKDVQDPGLLRAALEQLPPSGDGANGDPANAVLVGRIEDLAAALVRRGFRRSVLPIDDTQRMFGRPADIVIRKSGQGTPSVWMRLWLAPVRFQGQPVFVAQVGRPVGGRFAVQRQDELRLHPDVDEVRNLLIQDMMYSGGLQQLGFINGVGSRTAGEDPDGRYFTDGLRAVMFFVTRPLDLSEVKILDWVPYLRDRTTAAAREHADER